MLEVSFGAWFSVPKIPVPAGPQKAAADPGKARRSDYDDSSDLPVHHSPGEQVGKSIPVSGNRSVGFRATKKRRTNLARRF